MGEFNLLLIPCTVIRYPAIVIASKAKQSNGFSYYSVYSVNTDLQKKHAKAGISSVHNHFRPDGHLQRSKPDSAFMLKQRVSSEMTESFEMSMDCHGRSFYSLPRNDPDFNQCCEKLLESPHTVKSVFAHKQIAQDNSRSLY